MDVSGMGTPTVNILPFPKQVQNGGQKRLRRMTTELFRADSKRSAVSFEALEVIVESAAGVKITKAFETSHDLVCVIFSSSFKDQLNHCFSDV